MWEQSLLTSTGQLEALRLVSGWWDSSRRGRTPWGPRRAGAAAERPAADGLRLLLQRVPERRSPTPAGR